MAVVHDCGHGPILCTRYLICRSLLPPACSQCRNPVCKRCGWAYAWIMLAIWLNGLELYSFHFNGEFNTRVWNIMMISLSNLLNGMQIGQNVTHFSDIRYLGSIIGTKLELTKTPNHSITHICSQIRIRSGKKNVSPKLNAYDALSCVRSVPSTLPYDVCLLFAVTHCASLYVCVCVCDYLLFSLLQILFLFSQIIILYVSARNPLCSIMTIISARARAETHTYIHINRTKGKTSLRLFLFLIIVDDFCYIYTCYMWIIWIYVCSTSCMFFFFVFIFIIFNYFFGAAHFSGFLLFADAFLIL